MAESVDVGFQPEMRSSFSGRVRNYNLPPTARNALMPVFEAITNSLYAIEERFPEDWADKGLIDVRVIRSNASGGEEAGEGAIIGFEVSDNGLGLDDRLFGYFQELDTEYRADQNGRGIGRLSWLKVFRDTGVSSIFKRGGNLIRRTFDFRLNQENPFRNYAEAPAEDDTGTTISLRHFRDGYVVKVPQDTDEIKRQILSHFIAVFAQPKRLQIRFSDRGASENLSQFFFSSVRKGAGPSSLQYEGYTFLIQHMLVDKRLAPIGNNLVYCAANRAVVFQSLNDFLGMKTIIDPELGALVYIGLVSGGLFNEHLNHERTGFDFGDNDFDIINKAALDSTKEFLGQYLIAKKERSRRLLAQVLEINPLYASAVGDVEAYAESMPLGWDETQLVRDVAVKRYRAQKALIRQVEKLESNTASMSDEQFSKHVHEITNDLGDAEKSALAQYVVERKIVIELLQASRRIDLEKSEHQSEAMVHEVFCPLGVTSDVLDYDDHNLWLLDDRLAYYSYIASDRPIKTFARDAADPSAAETEERAELQEIKAYSETCEPDLAIFKRPMLFRRSKTPDPVVIVEFKSPGKVKYSGSVGDNPVWQIRKYIESLVGKECYDFDGNRISDIKKGTPFHCYLVAEASVQLEELLKAHGIWKPTPDGNGRFGYIDDLDAYFEFIPYDQVLENARLRNEAFFRKLNLMGDLERAL